MSNVLNGLLGLAAIVAASGCASGQQRECSAPPPPPPPPCCCGQQPGNGPQGFGWPRQDHPGQPGGSERAHGHRFGPPPEAMDACKDKKVNDSCKVEQDGWTLNGTCVAKVEPGKPMPEKTDANPPQGGPDERLICAPPHPNAPVGGEAGKPMLNEKTKK